MKLSIFPEAYKPTYTIFFFLQHWVFLAFCAGFLQLQQVKATLHVVLRLLIAVASLAAEHRL